MIEKLKKLQELGISYAAIASNIGVTRQAVSAWATRVKDPNAINVEKFNKWLEEFKEEVANL